MAWSVKIQSGTGGTQGYNEFQAVYDAASQTALKLKYGFSLGNQAPDVLFHTPDNGAPIPVRTNGANRLLFLTVDIPASATWDSVTGLVNTLARLVDGPNSQAVRAQTAGDVDKVRVAIKPNGATYTTYFEVLTGFMDTSTAFTEPAAVINTVGRNVTLALTCKPFGYGDSFTLSNRLASSPHMLEDSNDDGRADGLSATGTATSESISSVSLCGGSSQRFQTDDSTSIGYNQTVTADAGSTAVFYTWVYATPTGNDTLSIVLRNGAGTALQTKTFAPSSPTGYDKTAVDSGGRTWYRYSVSGTNTGVANFIAQVYRSSANATQESDYFLDMWYLQTGTTTAPPAFSSAYTLTNNALSYLDVWGVPGDLPAIIDMTLTPSGTNNSAIVLGARSDGQQLANKIRYRIDSTVFSDGVGIFTTTSNYGRATSGGDSDYYIAGPSGLTPTDDETTARAIGSTIFKLYAVVRSSSTSNGIRVKYISGGFDEIVNDYVYPTAANTWQLLNLGIINPVGLVVTPSNYNSSFLMRFEVTLASGSLDLDYVIMLPVSEQHIIAEGVLSTMPKYISGINEAVIFDNGSLATFVRTIAGSFWEIKNGNKMGRIVFHDYGTARAITAGNTLAISLTVTPRTSHLLGVS